MPAAKPKSASTLRFVNDARETVLAENVRVAKTFVTRLQGLLGTTSLPVGQGLLIAPCNSIHMFGMKYAIDCVFLDADNKVVGLVENIAPGKMSRVFGPAKQCLELPAGVIASSATQLGDVLTVVAS
ncbi:DUF192 domain-containing protein [bacterium]|nr:DUF192 domain-containing protein [bacterium]MBP9809059.1 DUF192 domain-containing protein [bacterium]